MPKKSQPTDREIALRILFQVWVSSGVVTPGDCVWLRDRAAGEEKLLSTCLRLAGYPEHSVARLEIQRNLLEVLRQDAIRDGRAVPDPMWVRDLKGRWVPAGSVREGELGGKLEHPVTYLPPKTEEAAPRVS